MYPKNSMLDKAQEPQPLLLFIHFCQVICVKYDEDLTQSVKDADGHVWKVIFYKRDINLRHTDF